MLGAFRTYDAIEPGQLDRKDLAVEEQQSREGLILRCGSDVAPIRQIVEERLDFSRTETRWMAFAME